MHIIGSFISFMSFVAFFCISVSIKKRVIGKMLSRQEDTLRMQYPNPLKTYEHVDIERIYSALVFLTSLGFFFVAQDQDGWRAFLMCYLLAALVYCLSDTIVFLIRMAAGCIQGAVLFDQKDNTFYVFPSVTTNLYRYKEYHASDLFYLIENYPIDKYEKGLAYVFFTKDEKAYAFKVNGKNLVDLKALPSRQAPIGMSIPFKYRYHTQIPSCLALIAAILVGYLLYFLC